MLTYQTKDLKKDFKELKGAGHKTLLFMMQPAIYEWDSKLPCGLVTDKAISPVSTAKSVLGMDTEEDCYLCVVEGRLVEMRIGHELITNCSMRSYLGFEMSPWSNDVPKKEAQRLTMKIRDHFRDFLKQEGVKSLIEQGKATLNGMIYYEHYHDGYFTKGEDPELKISSHTVLAIGRPTLEFYLGKQDAKQIMAAAEEVMKERKAKCGNGVVCCQT